MDTNTHQPIPIFDTLEYINKHQINLPELNDGDAKLDCEHSYNFLYSYRGSPATFNSYRREIERFLQWSWFTQNKSIKSLTRMDFEIFLEFCQSPPKHWIGIKHVERFIEKDGLRLVNPEWRPFVAAVSKKAFSDGKTPNIKSYSLSSSALQAIFSIMSSFYNYLQQEEYVTVNPVSQIREKSQFLRKKQHMAPVR